jgi:hypothetical protein
VEIRTSAGKLPANLSSEPTSQEFTIYDLRLTIAGLPVVNSILMPQDIPSISQSANLTIDN